jgi:hypothetical protein
MGSDDVLSMMIFRALAMNQAAKMMQNGETDCCTQHYTIGIQNQCDWSSWSQEKKSNDYSLCRLLNDIGKISSIGMITVLS